MNLSALKTFAPAVRLQLIEAVTRKLDFVLTGDTADLRAMSAQRDALRKQAEHDRKGLIERVAYTWFNRLTALRFIDARGWHPFAARVVTAVSSEETLPELLRLVREGRLPDELATHTDLPRINRLLDGALPSANPQSEVYRHLVLAACRFYHALLPDIFEKLNDETELLLPDDLLTEHSVMHGFRTEISDGDCAEVEILGWLYQFYISERKDQVMARKSAVPTEDIPAVTQLFTPHWIVRYLVENSLGRLWLLNRPGSRLREHMPYYIEGELEADFLRITKPEEIRLCDPAVGSGHMLTYAFDLLTLIYGEEGYAPNEIPALILRHNLHGLEICPRAAQLAELALVFKAREKSHRFFQAEHLVRPRIIELRDVCFAEGELSDYFKALGAQPSNLNSQFATLLYQFEEAKTFGSLIQPCLSEPEIVSVRNKLSTPSSQRSTSDLIVATTHLKVVRVLEQAQALTQRYHVVVANPPYMGGKFYNERLAVYIKDTFPNSKADLFAVFMERSMGLLLRSGKMGMINLPSWLFLSTFETLRRHIIDNFAIDSMLHMGRGIFGIDWGSVAIVLTKLHDPKRIGHFFRLHERTFQHLFYDDIGKLFLLSKNDHTFKFTFSKYRDNEGVNEIAPQSSPDGLQIHYTSRPSEFRRIHGQPFAYWVSEHIRAVFQNSKPIGDVAMPRQGLATADNERFLRSWHELGRSAIQLGMPDRNAATKSGKKWFPYNKGGDFRKWYGNVELVINWKNDGEELFANRPKSVIRNPDFYFRKAITWSFISSVNFGIRICPQGFVFDVQGSSAFPSDKDFNVVAGFLCSKLTATFLQIINPTISFQVGNIAVLPWLAPAIETVRTKVSENVEECLSIAKNDWDNFETSWDFRDQPLFRPGLKGATLAASWLNWEAHCAAAICRMRELESENNRLFIGAYGLDGELEPDVPEEQITLVKADARSDIAAFLSYGVGCMMGRYSLDRPGLILADAGETFREFVARVGVSHNALTFVPDGDGIIPVLDGEWFEDDIVARTRDFLRATFGEATLNDNLRFIEEALGKDLRRYFLTDFYKNHLSNERGYGYKKRPIYWLFRSPKGAFSALVYMHRMSRDTPNILLNRYLRNYLQKLRAHIEHLDHAQATSATAREKTVARKESEQLKKNLRECEEWERDVLLPLAQSRPEFNLDDGVKVNYLKFGAALAPIPGLAAADDE